LAGKYEKVLKEFGFDMDDLLGYERMHLLQNNRDDGNNCVLTSLASMGLQAKGYGIWDADHDEILKQE